MRRLLPLAFVLLAPALAHADGEDTVRTRSPAMVATGIGSMTIGTAAVGFGIGFVSLYANQITTFTSACPLCGTRTIPRDSDYLVGGTIAIVTGALAILGGIPLVYFGAKHERRTTASVWLTAGGVSGRF